MGATAQSGSKESAAVGFQIHNQSKSKRLHIPPVPFSGTGERQTNSLAWTAADDAHET
jgi:hypothetical protein